jgi:hypothetical protein
MLAASELICSDVCAAAVMAWTALCGLAAPLAFGLAKVPDDEQSAARATAAPQKMAGNPAARPCCATRDGCYGANYQKSGP